MIYDEYSYGVPGDGDDHGFEWRPFGTLGSGSMFQPSGQWDESPGGGPRGAYTDGFYGPLTGFPDPEGYRPRPGGTFGETTVVNAGSPAGALLSFGLVAVVAAAGMYYGMKALKGLGV